MSFTVSAHPDVTILCRFSGLTGEVEFLGAATRMPRGGEDVRHVTLAQSAAAERWVAEHQAECRRALVRAA